MTNTNNTNLLASASTVAVCPTNGKRGKLVDTLTLKALLRLPLTQLPPGNYRFCREPDCPTVYYEVEGGRLFEETVLREKVYQKHPNDDDALVCYCFGYTVGDVRGAVAIGTAGAVVEAINAGVQAGQCACEVRNPQGSCCLGNVRALMARLESGL